MMLNELLAFLNKNGTGLTFSHPKAFILAECMAENVAAAQVQYDLEPISSTDSVFEVRSHITNISSKPARLRSAVLEFKVAYSHTPNILRNGWQSISPTFYQNPEKEPYLHDRLDVSCNPYSYKTEYGYIKGSFVSEWFTQFMGDGSELTMGATTTNRFFSQVIVRRVSKHCLRLRITSQLDDIVLGPGEAIAGEHFAFVNASVHTLAAFTELVAQRSNIHTPKPPSINGICCSYYTRYADRINQRVIEQKVAFLDRHRSELPIEYVQIDDGYARWGDWTSSERSGIAIADMVRSIHAHGFKAGLWIAPTCIDKKAGRYAALHAAVLHDNRGRTVSAIPFRIINRFILRSRVTLDPTHPEFLPRLEYVLDTFVREWGIELLKCDFMSGPALCAGTFHVRNATRVDALRGMLRLIRIKTEGRCLLISAIAPLSLMPGFADFARITNDVTFPFVYGIPLLNKAVNGRLLRSLLRSAAIRAPLGNKLWVNDFDCFVADPVTGLNDSQVAQAFNMLLHQRGILMIGDDLRTISRRVKRFAIPLLHANKDN